MKRNLEQEIEKIIKKHHLEMAFARNFMQQSNLKKELRKKIIKLFSQFCDDEKDKAEFVLLNDLLDLANKGNDLKALIESQLKSERYEQRQRKKKLIQSDNEGVV